MKTKQLFFTLTLALFTSFAFSQFSSTLMSNVGSAHNFADGTGTNDAANVGTNYTFAASTVTGDGKQTRDFVYVGDLVEAIEKSISFNGVLNIGSGEEISIIDIAKMFKDDIKFIPERKEIKRSLADVYNAYFWINWKPKTSLKEWIKSKL